MTSPSTTTLPRPGRWGCAFALLACLAVSGCVEEKMDGEGSAYGYEMWVPAVTLVGGLAAIPLGWMLRAKSSRFGWTLLILGAAAVFGGAPSLYLDKVLIGAKGLSIRTGIVGTTAYDVKFDDVKSVSVTTETTTGRRGRKTTTTYFLFEGKSGEPKKVPFANAVTRAAVPRLLDYLGSRNIPVVDRTPPQG